MPILAIAALPVQGAGFIGDHVYVTSDTGLSWRCHGRNSGGAQVEQVTATSVASCICLALPDQGMQPGAPSIGNADAGIRFGFTGVCHQIAGRLMVRFNPSFRRVRGYGVSFPAYGAYGLGPWPERAACAAPVAPRLAGGATQGVTWDASGAWDGSGRHFSLTHDVSMRDDQGSFEEDGVAHAHDAGLAPDVIATYGRFGYDSLEAREAEISAQMDETIAQRVGVEERHRVIAVHRRLHQHQADLLRRIDTGELAPETGMEALTDERVTFFRECAEILGHERFADLFGDDLETTVAQFRGLTGQASPD